MLDERVVHGRGAKRAEDRDRLGRGFLRYHNSETRGDLRQEANEKGGAFFHDAALGDEARDLRHALRKHAANGKISAFDSVGRAGPPAQCKDLHARERSLRVPPI